MDSELDCTLHAQTAPAPRVAVVGAGRLGTALVPALRDAGVEVAGPLGRDDALPPDAGVAILAVPDAQIASAAAALPSDRADLLAGHCSAATTLEPLGVTDAFSLHPLMTITEAGATFAGATAAIA